MTLKNTVKIIVIFLILSVELLRSQSLEHPVIWTTAEDKAQILELVDNYSWANSIVSKLHSAVDSRVNTHISNPAAILNTIPAIPADDNLSESQATTNGAHSKTLNYASYAGALYYLTGEEKYAQFAADILSYYIDILALRTPDKTTICGNTFYDPRASYAQFSIAYDFIHSFLTKADTKVYKKSSGTKEDFDNVKAQKAVYNIAMNALHEFGGADNRYGQMVSNHPILRAPGVLFSILCVEDDTERERMFNVFWNKGTKEQNSFTKTILPMFGDQGIWPEAVSYSFMPNITLVLNLVDRLKPELNVLNGNMHILDGNFLFDNLRHPNRRFVRYGDSHRDNDGTGALYRYTLNLASRNDLDNYVQKAKVALRQSYDADGGYNPAVSVSTFDNYLGFEQLFWGINVPETIEGEINFQKPTVVIKHAGVALQRNYVNANNQTYGLCGIIGGAHYVHSHCTGITMELYGAGYIMAANAGLPKSLAERKIPVHTDYFWRHAGNNTMIVNGTTHGIQTGAWNSNSDLWMNTTVNVAAEPKHLEDPISQNFSFATQFLDDKVNNDQQQRTLSTIRTSATTGYYFDMFRSKSLGTNNFHDYVYHNLGDETHLFDSNGREISVSATTRYQTDIGDTHNSPGWRFFDDTKVTEPNNGAVQVRFDLNETNTYMNMFAPAGVDREYTKAIGPATREARGGYINKNTQIIAIRQQGEAWNKPYVHIFEPSLSTNTSVKAVEHLYRGDVIVGAIVTSQIGQKSVVDYVICQEDASKTLTLPDVGIVFAGRFAVVRYEQDFEKAFTTLYIGEGDSIGYGNISLKAGEDNKGLKVIEGEPYFGRQLIFKNIADKDVVPKGSTLSIEAIVGEDYVKATLWANDTINLGTKTDTPFIWSGHDVLTDMQDDEYLFTLVGEDAEGVVERSSVILYTPGQEPFTDDGLPHSIESRIQFEDYDLGGENLGYFDLSDPNTSVYSYRDTDRVDLGRNGTVVSYVEAQEWLEYTINVERSGTYKLSVRHATTVTPSVDAFTVMLPNSGDTLIRKFEALYTGRSSYYVDVVGQFHLNRGKQVLRFSFLNSGIDLDYFELTFINGGSTGIESKKTNSLKLSPNPNKGVFRISLPNNALAQYKIYTLDGIEVQRGSFVSEATIQMHTPISGMYLLEVISNKMRVVHKFNVYQ